jgi:hypothetical protein
LAFSLLTLHPPTILLLEEINLGYGITYRIQVIEYFELSGSVSFTLSTFSFTFHRGIVTILPRRCWAEFCQNQQMKMMSCEKWLLGTYEGHPTPPQLILILRTAILASRPSPTAYPA